MANIRISYEHARGCGYRKKGGMYMVSGGLVKACERLPIYLHVCPVCGGGIKFSRAWTWINPAKLIGLECAFETKDCRPCAIKLSGEKAGLIWVGEKFYSTTRDFTQEAIRQGICRRIQTIPHDFKLGETWIYLAHKKAVEGKEPGIFGLYKPERIEYVVKGDETEEELAKLEKRKITLVDVRPVQTEIGANSEESKKKS